MRIKDICLICIFIIFMITLYLIFTDSPSFLLKEYIINPVPESVRNIKVKQTKNVRGYGYVFGFMINEDDLNLIIKSRSLKQVAGIRYDGRYIEIDDESYKGRYMLIFQPEYGIKEPKWFNYRSWSKRYTYALVGDDFYDIIIYSKDKSKAYFCTRHWN